MKTLPTTRLALIVALIALGGTTAAAQDQNAAAERARIANQRIQAETEQRKREAEAGDQAQVATAAAAGSTPATAAQEAEPVGGPEPASSPLQPKASDRVAAATEEGNVDSARPVADTPAIDLSPVLEQIRTLGELKDAGYITDEEFERIKGRLLEGKL